MSNRSTYNIQNTAYTTHWFLLHGSTIKNRTCVPSQQPDHFFFLFRIGRRIITKPDPMGSCLSELTAFPILRGFTCSSRRPSSCVPPLAYVICFICSARSPLPRYNSLTTSRWELLCTVTSGTRTILVWLVHSKEFLPGHPLQHSSTSARTRSAHNVLLGVQKLYTRTVVENRTISDVASYS